MDINFTKLNKLIEPLSCSKSLDKKILHRIHDSEVFLSKCVLISENSFSALANIPNYHEYYLDHLNNQFDPLFLLECARQAETYIAHTYYDVPLSNKFILNNWSLKCTDDFKTNPANYNCYLNLKIFAYDSKKLKNQLYQQKYKIDVFNQDSFIASIYIAVTYVTDSSYKRIRGNCQEKISKFNSMKSQERCNIINPKLISRSLYKNVVISEPLIQQELCVLLHVDFNNISYFDHPQDHYPAMLLLEAGRQLSLLYLNITKRNIPSIIFKSFESTHFAYVEFDSEVFITINNPQKNEFEIQFIQSENIAAISKFTF